MLKRELWKTKVSKVGDALFTDAQDGDIVVPYVSFSISINLADPFHSVVGATGAGKSSVSSHGWIFLLTRHLVIHVYSSSTPIWARKARNMHKWATILSRALRTSRFSPESYPQTRSPRNPSALSLLTHQGSMTPMFRL